MEVTFAFEYFFISKKNYISNHCLNLQYNHVYIQIETDENKLVIVEDVPEKTAQEQTPQSHRFYCLPCKQNFSESDDYTKHMSRYIAYLSMYIYIYIYIK